MLSHLSVDSRPLIITIFYFSHKNQRKTWMTYFLVFHGCVIDICVTGQLILFSYTYMYAILFLLYAVYIRESFLLHSQLVDKNGLKMRKNRSGRSCTHLFKQIMDTGVLENQKQSLRVTYTSVNERPERKYCTYLYYLNKMS